MVQLSQINSLASPTLALGGACVCLCVSLSLPLALQLLQKLPEQDSSP